MAGRRRRPNRFNLPVTRREHDGESIDSAELREWVDLFLEGVSVEDIAIQRGRTFKTIEVHLVSKIPRAYDGEEGNPQPGALDRLATTQSRLDRHREFTPREESYLKTLRKGRHRDGKTRLTIAQIAMVLSRSSRFVRERLEELEL